MSVNHGRRPFQSLPCWASKFTVHANGSKSPVSGCTCRFSVELVYSQTLPPFFQVLTALCPLIILNKPVFSLSTEKMGKKHPFLSISHSKKCWECGENTQTVILRQPFSLQRWRLAPNGIPVGCVSTTQIWEGSCSLSLENLPGVAPSLLVSPSY